MANRKVSIIERIRQNGKWTWGEKWELPLKLSLKEGARRGKFYLLWYSGDRKKHTPVPAPERESLACLRDSLYRARIKQRHLEDEADGLMRPDPIAPITPITIEAAILKPPGGHPLFISPSVDAAKRWRYEPAGQSTVEIIEFHFNKLTKHPSTVEHAALLLFKKLSALLFRATPHAIRRPQLFSSRVAFSINSFDCDRRCSGSL
jgi:hypothetical protein